MKKRPGKKKFKRFEISTRTTGNGIKQRSGKKH